MAIKFVKMHGIGNDYVYVDCVTEPGLEPRFEGAAGRELIRAMSDRHRGVGSDGVILVCAPKPAGGPAEARMRMFNADGSEAQMCGNGIRCVAKFAHDRLGVRVRPLRIQTGRGVLAIDYRVDGGRLVEATVDMGEPILDAAQIPVEFPRGDRHAPVIDAPIGRWIPWSAPAAWMENCQIDQRMTCVSMGNPHVVIFCGNAAAVSLETLGPFLERQPVFPERINVHVAQVVGRGEVIMRTWERGAGITLACGTGACAVVVAGALTDRLAREALVHLPGGDLRIAWAHAGGHVLMTGPAEEVFEGVWRE